MSFAKYLTKALPANISKKAEAFVDQAEIFQKANAGFHFLIGGFTLLTTAGQAMIFITAAKAASISAPAMALALQSAVLHLLAMLPISVANLGVREFTLMEFLKPYNANPDAIVAMSVIIFSTFLLMALIGACCQAVWAVGSRRKKTKA